MASEPATNTTQLMMPMTIEEVADVVNGRLIGLQTVDAAARRMTTSVVTDSRQVTAGSVFVAIPGEHVDGHDYVETAQQLGAIAAIVEHSVNVNGIAQIVVDNSVDALGLLAAHNIVRRRATGEPFTIIGITGSVGKTTTKDLLSHVLGTVGETVAPVGSFNNEIGLPLTALKVGEHTRFLVAEMGANHLGEIARLTRIAPPDMAIVLKVGVAHLGEFGSVEHIAQAKSEIIHGLIEGGTALLNADDVNVAAMAPIARDERHGSVAWFGIEHASEHERYLTAIDIDVDELGRPRFALQTRDDTSERITLGLVGSHNIMNALAAASAALTCGMDLNDVALQLASVQHISAHRMAVHERERNGRTFTLIDDSFNANPDSMRAGLDGLTAWRAHDEHQPYRVAVLGAMLELGGDETALHRSIGEYAVQAGADAVIAVGGDDEHLDTLAGALYDGASLAANVANDADDADGTDGADDTASITTAWAHNADEADELIARMLDEHEDAVVLFKGSHASGLSSLAERWTATNE